MDIKRMKFDGTEYNIPNEVKCIIMKNGSEASRRFYLSAIRSLLTCDYTNEYDRFGGKNDVFSHDIRLYFNEGKLYTNGSSVKMSGAVTNYHVVDSSLGENILSIIYSEKDSFPMLDMTNYTGQVEVETMHTIANKVNKFAGYIAVDFTDGVLSFTFKESDQLLLKAVYLLVAECYLTPDGYKRVVLLHDTGLDDELYKKLLSLLITIPRLDFIMVSDDLDTSDINERYYVMKVR